MGYAEFGAFLRVIIGNKLRFKTIAQVRYVFQTFYCARTNREIALDYGVTKQSISKTLHEWIDRNRRYDGKKVRLYAGGSPKRRQAGRKKKPHV